MLATPPDLTALPTATLLEYRRALKYSEDEPRDDHGRWTSDGGQSAASMTTQEADRVTSRVFGRPTPYESPSALDARLAAALPNARFLLPGATMSTKIALTAAAERFARLFPRAAQNVTGIGFRALPPGVMAQTHWQSTSTRLGPLSSGITMELSQRYFGSGSSDRVEVAQVANVLAGWHVPEETGKEEVLAHEFGHAVHATYPDDLAVSQIRWSGMAPVSRYGSTDSMENFAEVYVQYAYGSSSTWADATTAAVRMLGWPDPSTVKLEKASPLTFADQARRALRQGYADAYAAGWGNSGYDGELDSDQLDASVDPATDSIGGLLAALGALLVGGSISDAMFDARLGQYAATLNSMYEEGFGDGVGQQGQVTSAEWHTTADAEVCELCDGRDGQVWLGDDPHPYPGEGYYGDVCEGGPNCRCELWYDVVLPDPGADQLLGPDSVDQGWTEAVAAPDLAKLSTATLRAAHRALKYDDSEPRDDRGRWTDGGSMPDTGSPAWQATTAEIARQGMGNCYQAAGTLLVNAAELGLTNPTVVQATCVGQGPIAGMPFGHSWLEFSGPMGVRLAVDYASGNRTILPADFYRQLGQAHDVHEYDRTEALRQMVATGHYGPWGSDPPNTGPGRPVK